MMGRVTLMGQDIQRGVGDIREGSRRPKVVNKSSVTGRTPSLVRIRVYLVQTGDPGVYISRLLRRREIRYYVRHCNLTLDSKPAGVVIRQLRDRYHNRERHN